MIATSTKERGKKLSAFLDRFVQGIWQRPLYRGACQFVHQFENGCTERDHTTKVRDAIAVGLHVADGSLYYLHLANDIGCKVKAAQNHSCSHHGIVTKICSYPRSNEA